MYRFVHFSLQAAVLAALLVVLVVPTRALAERKPRVVSVNLCTDQLLMLLADHKQILALSHLSRDKAGSWFYERARQYPVTSGQTEEVLPLTPDVVIAGTYTTPHTLKMLTGIGFQVEKFDVSNSISELFANIRRLAGILGQQPRGEQLLAQLERRLAALPAAGGDGPVAAYYDTNGYTVGAKTLRGELLSLAGWQNAAEQAGIEHYGVLSLESLVLSKPDLLVHSPYAQGTYSRGGALAHHPAITEAGLNPAIIIIPSRQTVCGGPWTIDLVERLAMERVKFTDSPNAL